MECNKDEALRAKKIAEEKMVKNDFEGARKIALKAKQLFPELDNISQLLTVCDIHCASQKKIYGAGKDLYGILQVENVADETMIRKQYRKLALVLHPDKNKFPGAEAAFKLIGEANMTLSDEQKRSAYDFKCREPARASVTKIQNRQGYQTYADLQNKFKTAQSSQFNNVNNGQQATSNPGTLSTFWTYCPFCNIKYEYYREFEKRPLRCQHCSKIFIAYDIGSQGRPAGAPPSSVNGKVQRVNLGSKPVSQKKEAGEVDKVKGNVKKDSRFTHKKTESDRMKQEGVTKSKVKNVHKSMETGTAKDTKRKRGKKMAVESSETSSDKKEAAGGGVSDGPGAKGTNKNRGRKTAAESSETCSDKKEAVGSGVSGGPGAEGTNKKRGRKTAASETSSDKKEVADGGVSGGPGAKGTNKKRGRKTAAGSSSTISDEKEVAGGGTDVLNERRSPRIRQQVSYQEYGGGRFSPNKRSKPTKPSKDEAPADVSTEELAAPDNDSKSDSDPVLVDCPDQDFTNFDKDKEEHCFAVDQIWACYDSVDSMPRFYAQIRKVYSSKFRLRITWFESDPDNALEMKWVEEGLPVACGKFELGETDETTDRLMFSHQIVFKKGASKSESSYVISPQKGEIWALYKDWDIKWSLDPENHTNYKFDIVEIVEVDADGISVGFLLKVKGFGSVFQRAGVGDEKIKIPSNDRFRFSHHIPSAKLTGTERAGVPVGSFELDMASLPADFEDYCSYSSNNVNTASKPKVKPTTPKKHMNCVDKDMLKLRRSPRGLKSPNPNL